MEDTTKVEIWTLIINILTFSHNFFLSFSPLSTHFWKQDWDDYFHQLTTSLSLSLTTLGSEGVLVFSDRQIWAVSLVPLQEQVQALVSCQRLDEAFSLLDGVQSRLPQHSYEVKQSPTCVSFFGLSFIRRSVQTTEQWNGIHCVGKMKSRSNRWPRQRTEWWKM